MDPKHPGGIDEILNFGAFWNEEGIRQNRDKIVSITAKLGKLYRRVYRFLAAAKSLRDDMEVIYEEALDKGKFNLAVTKLKAEILSGIPYTQKEGKTRHLFGSAYSPDGPVDYYETIIEPMKKVYYIKGSYVKGKSRIMEQIVEEAIKKGLFIEIYHEPLVETNIETILIPELDVAVTVSKKYEEKNQKIFDIEDFMNEQVLEENREKLIEDQNLIDELVRRGLANSSIAKIEHDELEKCYIANMNFAAINDYRDKIIERILKYAEEIEN